MDGFAAELNVTDLITGEREVYRCPFQEASSIIHSEYLGSLTEKKDRSRVACRIRQCQ